MELDKKNNGVSASTTKTQPFTANDDPEHSANKMYSKSLATKS